MQGETFYETLGGRIREARRARGLSQQNLADLLGVTQQAYQRYEAGKRKLRADDLRELCLELGITASSLLGVAEPEAAGAPSAFSDTPLFGSIAAGTPIDMEAADLAHPVPTVLIRRYPNAFLLRVEGESMNRILPNGCYALVDPTDDIDVEGQPYAVCVGEHRATIKRVSRLPEGGLVLAPDSDDPAFRPQVLDPSDSAAEAVSVIGRVVWHCIPFDWDY